jgi:hypothetical protein
MPKPQKGGVYGRVWQQVSKAEDGLTVVYVVFERSSLAMEAIFIDGCMMNFDANMKPDRVLELIGRTTRAEAFPPETPL